MQKNKKIFSNNLKYYMSLNNKTRNDLSNELKISYSTISDWVNGKVVPRSTKIDNLAEYFGISVGDLYKENKLEDVLTNSKSIELDKAIDKYSNNEFQKELLSKCTMLNLDNTKRVIEQVDYYIYRQDIEEQNLKFEK